MTAWTPKQVLRELIYIDPDVNQDRSVSITVPAKGDAPERHINLGTEHRLSARWADNAHNALGSFLHHPTLKQMRNGDAEIRPDTARRKAAEVIEELDRVLGSTLSGFKAGQLVVLKCACGTPLARDAAYLESGKDLVCSGGGCKFADWWDEEVGAYGFQPRQASWPCPECTHPNTLPLHELKEGERLICSSCAGEFEAYQKFHLRRPK